MTNLQDDEQTLVEQAQSGDANAFAELVTQHGRMIYNLCLRTLENPHEAEDVAQETFLRAWKALPRFRAQSRLSTWLYRIATNLCYNRLPHLQRELSALNADEVVDLPDERQGVEAQIVSAESVAVVDSAVKQLPESYRLLIILRHMQGLSYAEIADVTGMPLSSVKTGIFRARHRLREQLADQSTVT